MFAWSSASTLKSRKAGWPQKVLGLVYGSNIWITKSTGFEELSETGPSSLLLAYKGTLIFLLLLFPRATLTCDVPSLADVLQQRGHA